MQTAPYHARIRDNHATDLVDEVLPFVVVHLEHRSKFHLVEQRFAAPQKEVDHFVHRKNFFTVVCAKIEMGSEK